MKCHNRQSFLLDKFKRRYQRISHTEREFRRGVDKNCLYHFYPRRTTGTPPRRSPVLRPPRPRPAEDARQSPPEFPDGTSDSACSGSRLLSRTGSRICGCTADGQDVCTAASTPHTPAPPMFLTKIKKNYN